jgi:hypothetical protein
METPVRPPPRSFDRGGDIVGSGIDHALGESTNFLK